MSCYTHPYWLTEAVAVRSPKFRVLDHADTSKSPFLPSLHPQLPWKTPPLFLPESSLSFVPWFRLIVFSTSRLLQMLARSAYPSLVKNWCWLFWIVYTVAPSRIFFPAPVYFSLSSYSILRTSRALLIFMTFPTFGIRIVCVRHDLKEKSKISGVRGPCSWAPLTCQLFDLRPVTFPLELRFISC